MSEFDVGKYDPAVTSLDVRLIQYSLIDRIPFSDIALHQFSENKKYSIISKKLITKYPKTKFKR